jgi:hypothetical protein
VKERPIIFKREMVGAILEGRKTQTRRVITGEFCLGAAGQLLHSLGLRPYRCPYGVPGDRLWVREGWMTGKSLDSMSPKRIARSASDAGYSPGAPVWYLSDGAYRPWGENDLDFEGKGKARPSIFMPRWASRLLLEIADVRVERVQDISEADAMNEGVLMNAPLLGIDCSGEAIESSTINWAPSDYFKRYWDSINAKRGFGWDSNPWVWAISFKAVPSNVQNL